MASINAAYIKAVVIAKFNSFPKQVKHTPPATVFVANLAKQVSAHLSMNQTFNGKNFDNKPPHLCTTTTFLSWRKTKMAETFFCDNKWGGTGVEIANGQVTVTGST